MHSANGIEVTRENPLELSEHGRLTRRIYQCAREVGDSQEIPGRGSAAPHTVELEFDPIRMCVKILDSVAGKSELLECDNPIDERPGLTSDRARGVDDLIEKRLNTLLPSLKEFRGICSAVKMVVIRELVSIRAK